MKDRVVDRRKLVAGLAGAALAAPAVGAAGAAPDTRAIERALRGFDKLPGDIAYLLRVGPPGVPWETSRDPNARLFCGSAVKTFILARFLMDIENGRLPEHAHLPIDDGVRSLRSHVFLHLEGTAPTTSVLEAMIAHSDNTATDVALALVGAERVRAFVGKAGLASVQIPASTRQFFSYLAGARYGVDVGWAGMQQIEKGHDFGPLRSPMNHRETMKCTAADFVSYYERILAGDFIRTPAMRTEFRRISAMARTLWRVVPESTPAYGKGGSIEWDDFNCFCLPGQMLLGGAIPVTFSFCINWEGKPRTVDRVSGQFTSTIREVLAATAQAFG